MRQCPTLAGDERPLIAHSIASEVCMQRQREFYHKCHRCVFRGKAADFCLPEEVERNGVARGVAEPGVTAEMAAAAQRSNGTA